MGEMGEHQGARPGEGLSKSPVVAIVPATSNVGRATVRSLVHSHPKKVQIRAGGRSIALDDSLRTCSGIEVISGVDAFHPETHQPIFEGAQRCFIVAPKLENRVEAVNLLLTSAQQCGVKQVVLVGGVFQEEEIVLMHKQWQSTRRHAESLGLAWTQLQCVDFMENTLQYRVAIASEGRMYGTGRSGKSPAVAVQDIGAAAASILACEDDRHDNKSYKIVGPTAIGPDEMAAAFSDLLGRQINFVDFGLARWKQDALAQKKMPEWQIQGFYDWLRLYFLTGKLVDVRSDLPALGVQPTSFRDWLTSHTDLFKPSEKRTLASALK